MPCYSSHFWNLHNVYRIQEIIVGSLFLVLLSKNQSIAQNELQKKYNRNKPYKEIHLPNYDDRWLHYGFFLALNYNRLIPKYSAYYFETDSLIRAYPVGTAGFALGFLANFRIHDQWAIKLVPSVGFYDRSFMFIDPRNNQKSQTVETAIIELQFLAKYRSVRRDNSRMYLIGGIKPGIRAGGRRGSRTAGGISEQMTLGRYDITLEYGAGFDIYFQYFKFSPEIRFSHGVVNMNTGSNNRYNQSFDRLLTHTVTLYFFFE